MSNNELLGKQKHERELDEPSRVDDSQPESLDQKLLDMQRRAGNRSVNAFVQTKLEVGGADDTYEREADEIATSVLGHQGVPSGGHGGHAGDGFTAPPELASFVGRGGGAPLASGVRRKLEPRFGLDFKDVRVHTDSDTGAMAESIGARAFTFGNDVYFGQGAYRPGSRDGDHLLAHELTHVVQQTGSAQRKVARSFDGAKVPTRLARRRIQGNFLKKAKTMVTNLTGKSKEEKRTKTGSPELEEKSKPELQQYMARTKGGGPAENPDWSNPKFFGQQPDKFQVKLAVAQEDANWLKNAKELRNVGIKEALSSKGRKQLMKGGDEAEEYLGKKVLEQRGELDGLSDTDIKARVETFTSGIHDVGHTWIRLETYVGGELKDLYSYGMWPAKVAKPNDSGDNWGGYGGPHQPGQGEVRHPDNQHEDDAIKAYFAHSTKKDKFDKALTLAGERYKSPPPYVLLGYNCTAFAKEIFQAAGGSYPSGGKLLPGFAYTPGNLYTAIAKTAEKDEKKKTPKGKAKKEDEHKDLVEKVKAKQEKLSTAGKRDTQSEMFAIPKDDAKTAALTFYAGKSFSYGQRPDFAEDNKVTLDKNRQMTAVENDEAADRWDVGTFWMGPKKYWYVPLDDVDDATEEPKAKKEEAKGGGSGPQLQMYNGTSGGFHKPAPSDAPNRAMDVSTITQWKIENTEGEWINIQRLGEYYWVKESHFNYFKDPTNVPLPLDLGGVAPKVEEEVGEPMVGAKGIPLYDTMVGMKATRLLATEEAKFLTFDELNDDWRVVMVDGKDVYVREEDYTMWKMMAGIK